MKNLIIMYNDLLATFSLIQSSIWRNPPLSHAGQTMINSYVGLISFSLIILTYKATKSMPFGWFAFSIPFILNFIVSSKSKEEDFELAYKRLLDGSRKNRILRMGMVIILFWILPILIMIWLFSLGNSTLISL